MDDIMRRVQSQLLRARAVQWTAANNVCPAPLLQSSDYCIDYDMDGVVAAYDLCPLLAGDGDADGDGLGDACDLLP